MASLTMEASSIASAMAAAAMICDSDQRVQQAESRGTVISIMGVLADVIICSTIAAVGHVRPLLCVVAIGSSAFAILAIVRCRKRAKIREIINETMSVFFWLRVLEVHGRVNARDAVKNNLRFFLRKGLPSPDKQEAALLEKRE